MQAAVSSVKSVKSYLPINVDDLLHNRGVESERVELKASWCADTVGLQVLRTICAFANDHHNLNGGYVVIGVAERDGRAILPPSGLSDEEVEAAEKWIRGNCNRIDPPYAPVFAPELIENRQILVVWAPGSEMRPHRAPAEPKGGTRKYWVRIGSETVDAEQRGNLLTQLMAQTARVPWDERRGPPDAQVEDLREAKVREFLRDIRSGLLDEQDTREICRRMKITTPVNDHEVPKNTALLFFSNEPTKWFRGAKIEVVQFAADRAGDVQEERIFGGALPEQIRDCLNYLENLSAIHLQKQTDQTQVRGWVSYPLPALRETLVNAIYHRGYDVDQPEPTKIYLYPDRMEITSYPGPVPGIGHEHLVENARIPAAPARNRRIGEFLKELKLAEGRLSGMPKVFQAMRSNGSPPPRFEFDKERTWFRATLPSHPEYGALSALRDAAHLRALGQRAEAVRRVESAWESNPSSAILAAEMIRAKVENDEIAGAEDVLRLFNADGPKVGSTHVANALIEALIDVGDETRARRLLSEKRPVLPGQEAIDTAILARRLRDPRTAHQYFERAGEAVYQDPRSLHEFAQTKLQLAVAAHRRRQRESDRRLLREARPLLERMLQLDASPARHAWAWRDLARTLNWLQAPVGEVESAYERAITLMPEEKRFVQELDKLKLDRR